MPKASWSACYVRYVCDWMVTNFCFICRTITFALEIKRTSEHWTLRGNTQKNAAFSCQPGVLALYCVLCHYYLNIIFVLFLFVSILQYLFSFSFRSSLSRFLLLFCCVHSKKKTLFFFEEFVFILFHFWFVYIKRVFVHVFVQFKYCIILNKRNEYGRNTKWKVYSQYWMYNMKIGCMCAFEHISSEHINLFIL